MTIRRTDAARDALMTSLATSRGANAQIANAQIQIRTGANGATGGQVNTAAYDDGV